MNNFIVLFLPIISTLLLYYNFEFYHKNVDLSHFYPLQIFIYYISKKSINSLDMSSYSRFSLAYRFHKYFQINLYYYGTLITNIEALKGYLIKLFIVSLMLVLLPFQLTKKIFSEPHIVAFVELGFNIQNTHTILTIFNNSIQEGDLKILMLVILISTTGPLVNLVDHLIRVGKYHSFAYSGKIIKTQLSYAFVALSGILEKKFDEDIQKYFPTIKDLKPQYRLELFMIISFSVLFLLKYLDFEFFFKQKKKIKVE